MTDSVLRLRFDARGARKEGRSAIKQRPRAPCRARAVQGRKVPHDHPVGLRDVRRMSRSGGCGLSSPGGLEMDSQDRKLVTKARRTYELGRNSRGLELAAAPMAMVLLGLVLGAERILVVATGIVLVAGTAVSYWYGWGPARGAEVAVVGGAAAFAWPLMVRLVGACRERAPRRERLGVVHGAGKRIGKEPVMKIGMKKLLSMSFEDALTKVPEALKEEGFGVLTEIDVQKTLAQKLQVSFRRYKILGACNPSFAHRVLSLELDAGVMLPCNVIVYETDDGATAVTIVDPFQTLARESDPLREIAELVREKLEHVLERLG